MVTATAPSKFFLMQYYQKDRDLRGRRFETQLHKVRDGLAILELSPLLYEAGYTYGGAILNIPKELQGLIPLKETVTDIEQHDMVLLTTRPPLDEEGVRRPIQSSGSELEQYIFRSLRAFFRTCDRSEIVLAEELKPAIDDERVNELRAVLFYQSNGGRVRLVDSIARPREPMESRLTLGYLISIPTIPPRGFRLLVAFGMGGTETLRFCHLLRQHFTAYLYQALSATVSVMWMVPFLVPDYAPYPFLQCQLHDLQPMKEFSVAIKWQLQL
jgi:hypothetical protein